MRKSILFLALALLLAGISAGAWYYSKFHSPFLQGTDSNVVAEDSSLLEKQLHFACRLKKYAIANKCNSNAFRRFVVLHEMDCIPEEETFLFPVCQSDGCPAVAHGFLKSCRK